MKNVSFKLYHIFYKALKEISLIVSDKIAQLNYVPILNKNKNKNKEEKCVIFL